jgi:hypothetical protein
MKITCLDKQVGQLLGEVYSPTFSAPFNEHSPCDTSRGPRAEARELNRSV